MAALEPNFVSISTAQLQPWGSPFAYSKESSLLLQSLLMTTEYAVVLVRCIFTAPDEAGLSVVCLLIAACRVKSCQANTIDRCCN